MVRNSDFVRLVEELMDVLGVSAVYEGISAPSEFSELSPIWRGFYLYRANGDEIVAEEIFKREDDEEAERVFEEVMRSELDYRFAHAVLYELLKDIEIHYLITSAT